MRIDKELAKKTFRKLASNVIGEQVDKAWEEKVETLSKLCEEGGSKTHIAFLGTVMLAKSIDARADLFAIKPSHAKNNPHAFSARSLCHGVLVPLAAELGINIGVTGREPLNNQPYFRMTHLDDGTPIHSGSRPAFDYMYSLVKELNGFNEENKALAALEAFIVVRKKYQPTYTNYSGEGMVSPSKLTSVITIFVQENSEGGKRAQAVVAGLIDVFAGSDRVESGRVNDPSRKHPGDVCVRSHNNPEQWEKAIEVRDKPVKMSDVQIFGKKCIELGVREAALVMVSANQTLLDQEALGKWADSFGIGLTVFHNWADFVDQVLYWSAQPKHLAVPIAIKQIHKRLIDLEATPEAVKLWRDLSSK